MQIRNAHLHVVFYTLYSSWALSMYLFVLGEYSIKFNGLIVG